MSAKEMIAELKADLAERKQAAENLRILLQIERDIGKPNTAQEEALKKGEIEIKRLEDAISKHRI